VRFGYGAAPVLCDVSLALARGEMVALLGRNGAGKSTLLRLLSGVLTPSGGAVCLDGVPLACLGRRQIARRLGVVPQEVHVPFAFTVREVVALGRTAHVPLLHGESTRDRHAVERALHLLELEPLAARPYNGLSAGERQRAVLAMALAQEPRVLLLDEPTVHLDLAHQLSVLELVRGQNRSEGLAVLAAVHDLNLAALFFDRLVLLKDGHIVADGPPAAVVTAEAVHDVFGTAVAVYHHPTAGVPQMTLLPSGPPSV
jgi:iron complex transport system ATP-binding protein